jgi:hypothetical protein
VEEQETRKAPPVKRLLQAARPHASLHKMQQVAGLCAALISIGGFVLSYVYVTKPVVPTMGDVIAVVQEQRSDRPVSAATIEISTMKNAIVTTLTAQQGQARQVLKEGTYRFRVTHPRFSPEARQVQVMAGQVSTVRFRLSLRPVPVAPVAASPGAFDGIKKIFR